MKTFWALAVVFEMVCWCATAADRSASYPAGFLDAAAAFQAAPATNRYREAELLQKQLPVSPFKDLSYSGTASNFSGRGSVFITRELDKPSFILKQREVLRLLGMPLSTNSRAFSYAVSSEAASRFPVLDIYFHHDLAVDCGIYSVATGAETLEEERFLASPRCVTTFDLVGAQGAAAVPLILRTLDGLPGETNAPVRCAVIQGALWRAEVFTNIQFRALIQRGTNDPSELVKLKTTEIVSNAVVSLRQAETRKGP